ncbi:hypothetical protein MAPG_08435, partial [Magnaporthiopsis poae ATCC 64411]|uniref:Uncharacterized protein n=1 Tax=Magnaporthiopsis poae (strain ATCC 64411 / 73-15) TaxID=644358 RepID=A0A0C4E7C3_MAGP6
REVDRLARRPRLRLPRRAPRHLRGLRPVRLRPRLCAGLCRRLDQGHEPGPLRRQGPAQEEQEEAVREENKRVIWQNTTTTHSRLALVFFSGFFLGGHGLFLNL